MLTLLDRRKQVLQASIFSIVYFIRIYHPTNPSEWTVISRTASRIVPLDVEIGEAAFKAERLLRNLAQRLERHWSGVAGSILEGIDEILTVTRLGLPKELRRSLGGTSPTFNPNALAANDACAGKPVLLHHFPDSREAQWDALAQLALGDKPNGRRRYVWPDGLLVGTGRRWVASATGRDGCVS
jgi:hypothetical protein